MSTNEQWRKMAEESGLDCTLQRIDIKCVLAHEPVSGVEFMPVGWCGKCEPCAAIPCPDVCEACSYTDKYDIRQPVYWPCTEEISRRNKEAREAQQAQLDEIRQRRTNYGR